MRRPLALAVTLTTLAATVACGGPPGDPTLPTGQLTKDQYISAFERSADGLPQRYGLDKDQGDDAEAQANRIVRIQQLVRVWARRLDGLQPPAEALDAHRQYIEGLRSFADDLARPLGALRRGDERAARRLLDTGAALSAKTRRDLRASRAAFERLGYTINNLEAAPVPDTG